MIGNNIRLFREHLGMSQSDFAAALSITQGAVSQWEQDRTSPNVQVFLRMISVFGERSILFIFGMHDYLNNTLFQSSRFCTHDAIRRLRIQSGLSQQDVADLLNIDRTTVSKYEAGASTPSIQCIIRLSQVYKVPVCNIIGVLCPFLDLSKHTVKAAPQQQDGPVDELLQLCSQLTPENQQKAASYLRFLLEREQPDKPGQAPAPEG